jgi:hypothetical protein
LELEGISIEWGSNDDSSVFAECAMDIVAVVVTKYHSEPQMACLAKDTYKSFYTPNNSVFIIIFFISNFLCL